MSRALYTTWRNFELRLIPIEKKIKKVFRTKNPNPDPELKIPSRDITYIFITEAYFSKLFDVNGTVLPD